MPVIQLFRGEAAPGMANLDAIGTKKLDDRHSPFEEFAVRVGPSFVAAKAARQKVIDAIAQNLPGQQCAKAWTQLLCGLESWTPAFAGVTDGFSGQQWATACDDVAYRGDLGLCRSADQKTKKGSSATYMTKSRSWKKSERAIGMRL